MATPAGPRTVTADHILAAIALPTTEPTRATSYPLPLIQLSALPRDRSMRYAIARLDTSGRVADQATITALGWRPGDRLEATVTDGILLIRQTTTGGTAAVCTKGRVLIPANARHRASLTPGEVFIAAAPPAAWPSSTACGAFKAFGGRS